MNTIYHLVPAGGTDEMCAALMMTIENGGTFPEAMEAMLATTQKMQSFHPIPHLDEPHPWPQFKLLNE